MKLKFLTPIAVKIVRFYPGLRRELIQSRSKYKPIEMVSLALMNSIITSIAVFVVFLLLKVALWITISSTLIIFFLVLNYILKIPKLKVLMKKADLDSKLIYALDHMIIRLKAGATLFDAIKSIAISNYGELSKDFLELVKKIEGGMDEASAFESYAAITPSQYLRKVAWELAISVRSGGNVVTVLETLTKDLVEKSEIEIKNYASKLNLYLLMYMVLSIVLPALFIISMIVSSIISQSAVNFGQIMYLIPIMVLVVQFAIIGMINSSRPTLWVGR